ncbi:MAG TPA: hypothetical protein VFR97_02480 [Capillimicrobium sp.]|nr:hypothetical protein [Capillimicrobium sp.]
MALTDVAGVLSRKFVVGFFIPVFFGCVALKLLVAADALPGGLRDASGGTQILILGGVALLVGLLLWGVHYPLIRVLEGYWLVAPNLPERDGPLPDPEGRWVRNRALAALRRAAGGPSRLVRRARLAVGEWKRERWVRTRQHLVAVRAQPERSAERTQAASDLTMRFPPEDRLVLPTELGNVVRAFENHPRERYGLDGIPIWPSVVTMLSESERAELDETTTDVGFWLNSLVVVVVGGALLFAERLWHPPGTTEATAAIEVAIVAAVTALAVWMYRQLIAAAIRWGEPVRAAFDVHRLELYDTYGMRRPRTPEEDVDAGRALNRMLAFGEPIPLEWRAEPEPSDGRPSPRDAVAAALGTAVAEAIRATRGGSAG